MLPFFNKRMYTVSQKNCVNICKVIGRKKWHSFFDSQCICISYSTVNIVHCTVARSSLEKICNMNIIFDFIN